MMYRSEKTRLRLAICFLSLVLTCCGGSDNQSSPTAGDSTNGGIANTKQQQVDSEADSATAATTLILSASGN
jgi:hypothetical protein